MHISFHGHRPDFLRSAESKPDAGGQSGVTAQSPARQQGELKSISFGLFKMKVGLPSARQSALLAQARSERNGTGPGPIRRHDAAQPGRFSGSARQPAARAEPGAVLNTVTPRKTLLVTSAPCEQTCAELRNKAVAAIQRNDTAEVAYRYLQSRKGRQKTRTEAILFGVLSPIPGPLFLNVPPNIGNTLRYNKTKNGCKAHLIEQLGIDTFREIKSLAYDNQSLKEMARLLKEKGIDTASVDARVDKTFANNSWLGRLTGG